jgi:8-oxo-dGTP pyrophosphatase MutT (NUDIX family)
MKSTERGSAEGGWSCEATRTVYDNPWVRLREDVVVRPDGRRGIYGVLELKHRSVAVVAIAEDGDTFLVGQHRYPRRRTTWEIPQGGGPLDEEPLGAAQRELREETGLTAASWTYLGETFLANSTTDGVGCVFLARGLEAGPSRPEPSERLTVWRLPFAAAVEMAMVGEIAEILSVVGLARADYFLRTGRAAPPDHRDDPGSCGV